MLPKNERVLKETEGDDSMFNVQVRLKKLGYKDQYSRNMLQINNNGDYFTETALINNVADTDWSWSPLFADFNNDGHQDLFISNGILRRPNGLDFKKYVSSAFKGRDEQGGLAWLFNSINEMPSGKVSNEIFKGNSKKFESKTGDWIENKPNLSNGAIYVDLDLDGDLDIVTNNFGENALLYKNTTDKSKNYITLNFKYKDANQEGIGTKAILFNNGKRHYNKGISSVSKFKKENLINYTHVEDNYNDFLEEKLIPYKISTFGPALAKADIDGNGYEDVFIGNSSGKSAQLYLNSGSSFSLVKQPAFNEDQPYEDNDATFFDADNDGDLDLYVASGVNESKNENYQNDRLYINTGGKFIRSQNQIPSNSLITSTVKACDYDNDGDTDLFIGNLSDAKDFGKPVTSYILINDGKGNFKIDSNFKLSSKVTSALWEDINADGTKDLLVTTEWDAPKLYLNTKGNLALTEIAKDINGLWQSVLTYDIDNDGDQDILLGNWGLNTKFNLNFDGPLVMYHSDFDKNGINETLIAYNKDGKYYPMHSKDELSSQMNIISKIYSNHKSYAGKTIEEAITKGSINLATKYEVHTLASGYLRNDSGNFTNFITLEDDFQLGPITAFAEVTLNNEKQLIIGGNSYKVNTYHGAYNSLKGLLVKDYSNYKPVSNFGIEPFNSQIKQIETIKMKNKNLVLVLSNNDKLKVYSYQN